MAMVVLTLFNVWRAVLMPASQILHWRTWQWKSFDKHRRWEWSHKWLRSSEDISLKWDERKKTISKYGMRQTGSLCLFSRFVLNFIECAHGNCNHLIFCVVILLSYTLLLAMVVAVGCVCIPTHPFHHPPDNEEKTRRCDASKTTEVLYNTEHTLTIDMQRKGALRLVVYSLWMRRAHGPTAGVCMVVGLPVARNVGVGVVCRRLRIFSMQRRIKTKRKCLSIAVEAAQCSFSAPSVQQHLFRIACERTWPKRKI